MSADDLTALKDVHPSPGERVPREIHTPQEFDLSEGTHVHIEPLGIDTVVNYVDTRGKSLTVRFSADGVEYQLLTKSFGQTRISAKVDGRFGEKMSPVWTGWLKELSWFVAGGADE